jgi:hypothetical protein
MYRDPIKILNAPANGLLVVGCMNGVAGFITLVSGVLRLVGFTGKETLPVDRAEAAGFYFGTIATYAVALLSMLLAPVIIYAAYQMLNGQKLALARIASVLAILPLTSCCCILGLPLGIWSLVALSRPEVKELIRQQG